MATAAKQSKKSSVPIDEKFESQDFDMFRALEALDKKDYHWYENLTEEQKKKFVPFMLLQWMSTVASNKSMISNYYVLSTELNANLHMFNERVQHHPELQWLMLCSISPGLGKQFHQWIPNISAKIGDFKVAAKQKDVQDYFEKVYKNADKDDIKKVSAEFTKDQNHKFKLAKLYPSMKLDDVRILSQMVNEEDVQDYEERSGN